MQVSTPVSLTVRLAQMRPVLGDVAQNLQRHLELAEAAAAEGVDLIVFPEMSLCGYYVRDLAAEVALRRDAGELAALAEASRKVSILAGYVEETPECFLRLCAGYFEQGALVARHHKVYLPTYGMFDEERYFAAGERVRAFATRFGRMAALVCEDLWHPSTAYIAALDGAQIILAPANSPARGARGPLWDTARAYEALLTTYALLFGVYVVFVNRVGYEDGVHFWGGSRVIGPDGSPLAPPAGAEEETPTLTLDLGAVRRARIEAPLLADERLDLVVRELRRIADERARD